MPSLPYSTDVQSPDHHRAVYAMERILSSKTFSEMPRLKRLLKYVVTETIEGRGDRLKGVVIACEVFDKTDPDEAQSTTIVRVEAGRLRRRLADYYRLEGGDEALRITIPKGGYVVVFEETKEKPADTMVQQSHVVAGRNWFAGLNPVLVPALLIGLIAIIISWNYYSTSAQEQPPVQVLDLGNSKPIIAVLPFRNMVSNDPDASIAYGLTEDIITDLGGLTTLEVISLSSVLPFRELEIKPLDISTKLGAHYVLNGSVRGEPPDLRVTAQLYDAVNGVQLWAERFDRKMSNELDLQDEIAHHVVDSLSGHIEDHEERFISLRHKTDTETWSLYKQAMNLSSPPSDPALLELSLQAFKQVIEHDPNFAGGYAGVAYIHAFKAFFGHGQSDGYDVRQALEMAELARNLDPSFGLSYIARAFALLVTGDFEQALIASAAAVELSPNDPYVMTYNGFILCAAGNADEGISYAETALRLDPLNVRTPYLNILGVINLQAGHYQTALRAFQNNVDRNGPLGPGIHYFIAAAYIAVGDDIKAAESLRIADLLKDENYDWETWVRRSWKNQEDSERIFKLIERARQNAALVKETSR